MKTKTFGWTAVASVLAATGAYMTTPVTDRKALNLIPAQQMTALGADAYREVLAKERVSQDPALNELVRRVGQRIAKASGADFEWEFAVIDDVTPLSRRQRLRTALYSYIGTRSTCASPSTSYPQSRLRRRDPSRTRGCGAAMNDPKDAAGAVTPRCRPASTRGPCTRPSTASSYSTVARSHRRT